ncbi:MAG: NADPH-dependent oxidoreductase [Anaerolineales bacterium]
MIENPVLEVIHRHASVRHYKPDPLPKELIETIIRAAQRASTSSNLQAWSVIAVTEAERRQRLAALCGDQQHIAEAPLFLAWCADLARLDRVCELRGYKQVTNYVENFLVAALDAGIAAQNAALAAESLGLGICYIGAIRNRPEEVIELLALPRLTFPIVGMTVGWPARTPRQKPRLPLEAVLHWETYQRKQDEALLAYDREMAESGIYANRQVAIGEPKNVKIYGWMEHSARRVAQAQRTHLRRVLQQQGFELE